MNRGYCIICRKLILPGEKAISVNQKGVRSLKWFHTECANAEKKGKSSDNKN